MGPCYLFFWNKSNRWHVMQHNSVGSLCWASPQSCRLPQLLHARSVHSFKGNELNSETLSSSLKTKLSKNQQTCSPCRAFDEHWGAAPSPLKPREPREGSWAQVGLTPQNHLLSLLQSTPCSPGVPRHSLLHMSLCSHRNMIDITDNNWVITSKWSTHSNYVIKISINIIIT